MMERFYFPESYDKSQKKITGGWRQCNVNLMARDDVVNPISLPPRGAATE